MVGNVLSVKNALVICRWNFFFLFNFQDEHGGIIIKKRHKKKINFSILFMWINWKFYNLRFFSLVCTDYVFVRHSDCFLCVRCMHLVLRIMLSHLRTFLCLIFVCVVAGRVNIVKASCLSFFISQWVLERQQCWESKRNTVVVCMYKHDSFFQTLTLKKCA